jgi:predicted DNA-binding protein
MKTAISIPDDVFERIEREAEKLGLTRSAFMTRAATHYLAELRHEGLTAQINRALRGTTPEERAEQQAWTASGTAGLARALEDDEW